MKRDRGQGRIFLRGNVWWVQFYVDGQQQREAAKTDGEALRATGPDIPKEAKNYLAKRLKEVHAHELDPSRQFVSQHDKRRTIAELMDSLKTKFQIREKATRQNLSNIRRVREDLGHMRAASLTAEKVDSYINYRLREGYAKASINRWTQLLHQAYKLAKLPPPRIEKLPEQCNERQGFFSEQEIRRVMTNLPSELADFTLFGWLTGMRKSEIASLAWEDVDGDVIRLRAENAKNRTARMIPLEGELAELMARRKTARQVEIDGTVMISSLIFHRTGKPIGDFRKIWARASKKAGIFRLFHDLRRSACRNMVNAGVPQSLAMKVSGHKTDSMFRRYAIAAESDLRTALRRTQDYLKTVQENVVAMPQPSQKNGDNSGTTAQVRSKRKAANA